MWKDGKKKKLMLVAHINFIVWQLRMIIFNKGYGSTVATLKFCNGEHAELCTEQHAFEPRRMAEAILLRSWAKKKSQSDSFNPGDMSRNAC